MKRHQDKVIIVTGGGRGLGQAYAQRLAIEGARVVIAEIDRSAGRATAAQKRMKGSIVTISSDTASWGSPRLLHYVTSKGAVEAFTRAMARELGPNSVRINCVAPGLLNNEATAGVPRAKREWNIQNRAIQREGTVEDITGVVSFLLSDDASFITGQLIVADGGLVFH